MGAASFLSSLLFVDASIAAGACGDVGEGTVVTCSNVLDNTFSDGIIYRPSNGIVLNIENGVVVKRSPADFNDGVSVSEISQDPIVVNLAAGASIATEGQYADGVEVSGGGDIAITSGARISVAIPDTGKDDGVGTNAILGNAPATSKSDIHIVQTEEGEIRVKGVEGSGLYGLNFGAGSVLLESSGTITTSGVNSYGMLSFNSSELAKGDTTAILHEAGVIITDGFASSGLYSLNLGSGSAFIAAQGTISTDQQGSDGATAYVASKTSEGAASVVLSDAAIISTGGKNAKGAWAMTDGLGKALVYSAAQVETSGGVANALFAQITNPASTATASVDLTRESVVLTSGAMARGVAVSHAGTGTGIVRAGDETYVRTTGDRADGIWLNGAGDVEFRQSVGAAVTVSGIEALGVNASGTAKAWLDLSGTVLASGEYGVGAKAVASAGPSTILVGTGSMVTGGWQMSATRRGANTDHAAAGILIGASTASTLTNHGTIGAGSDRAIVDAGRQLATPGNLTVNNHGAINGFVELAPGGVNVFNNMARGLYNVRHAADFEGDGKAYVKRVSVSDFGGPDARFNNNAGAQVRLAPITSAQVVDAGGYYIPTTGAGRRELDPGFYDLNHRGRVQGQFTNLATFNNAGVIDLRGASVGNTLVMTGNGSVGGQPGNGLFISNGGALLMNAELNAGIPVTGRSPAHADMLIVDGTRLGAGGPTAISVTKVGGSGALAPGSGIELVEVRNKPLSAAGAFVLNGEYVTKTGQQAVVSGAYSYALFQGGTEGDSNDGNWYLRSELTRELGGDVAPKPIYNPGAPVYEAYPQIIGALTHVPTMQQRIGNRHWSGWGVLQGPRSVFCKGSGQSDNCTVNGDQSQYSRDENGNRGKIEGSAVWARMEGGRVKFNSARTTSGADFDAETWRLQAGIDGLLHETEQGSRLIAGLTMHYGEVASRVKSAQGNGRVKAAGYGVGGTLTWLDESGFYFDGQGAVTWFDSDLSSRVVHQRLAKGNDGFGYAVSGEAGFKAAIVGVWTVTPQAQLIYSDVDFDSFTDPFGARVSLDRSGGLLGRLGLSLDRNESWTDGEGQSRRAHVYGIANLYSEFLDGTRVNVEGVGFRNRQERLWGGLGLGGSLNWNNDRFSVFGEVSADTSLRNFGDSYMLSATGGVRVRW